jgi:hypothetical protein
VANVCADVVPLVTHDLQVSFDSAKPGGGRFAIPRLRPRKIADNTFTVSIEAPPGALRTVHFSAICLDYLAGGPAPTAQQ